MPGSSQHQQERRNPMSNGHSGAERRHSHMTLSDRRHISPPLHVNICDSALSPQTSEHGRVDYSQRRNPRVSPHVQHSPPYFRQQSVNGDDTIKSESPSRKRRRLSRSGHHQHIVVEHQNASASPPQHRRSPRQQQQMQGSPPLIGRRSRYRVGERQGHGHPAAPMWPGDHPAFLPSPPPQHQHQHQSAVHVVDMQVCINVFVREITELFS